VTALRGTCLCGGVQIEVSGPFETVSYCHCTSCQKLSGGSGTASARVPVDAIKILAGRELLRTYQPAEGVAKTFCCECGSNVFGGGWPEKPSASVRLSVFDDLFDDRPTRRYFVRSLPSWHSLPEDGLERFDTLPPR
jgi:hypothetical protein